MARIGGGKNTAVTQSSHRKYALTSIAMAVAAALFSASMPAAAIGRLGNLDIVARSDGKVLPVYTAQGRNWVVGAPGQEYAIRFCNSTAGRVLAVLSVDGVNAVSGETASSAQSGYVLNAYECTDIQGWRKSLSRTAAFYFTELPDAYAARTGRPENVGVIGVAIFRERQPLFSWKDRGRIAAESRRDAERQEAPATPFAEPAGKAEAGNAPREQTAQSAADAASALPAPAPMAKLGTGHGRSEDSPVQMVRFDRESSSPNETIAIHYDRRENLVAMGILPPPIVARTPAPNPFPAWPRFVPDPPR